MHPTTILCQALLALSASAKTVNSNAVYDDGSRSMTQVACSDGQSGLITRYNWRKQSDVPRFPNIGGSDAVAGFNSPLCGACYQLQYKKNTINIFAIDHANTGFTISQAALAKLTGGGNMTRIDVRSKQVAVSACGL